MGDQVVQRPSGLYCLPGDYKIAPDPTCAPFEPVPSDVFITESTFGLPRVTLSGWPLCRVGAVPASRR